MRQIVVAAVALALSACGGPSSEADRLVENADPNNVEMPAEEDFEQMAKAPVPVAVPETPENRLTGPQANAARSAKQYLSMTGFSRQGLIDQLSSDAGNGYDVSDATVAVDSLNVDWNQQAVRSAKQYLELTGFSCKGLIEQLSSSYGHQYTKSEATYGATQAGAC